MTDTAQIPAEAEESPLLAKLRAAKEAGAGQDGFRLPVSKVWVSYPKFRPFDGWEKALLQAGGQAGSVNLYYILAVCKFDGGCIMAGDYRELITDTDHQAIGNKLFNQGSTEDAAGNG